MPDLQLLLRALGAITAATTAAVGVIFDVRKVYRLLRPLHVAPIVRLVLDGAAPDEIHATVTTRSGEAHYIVRCQARSTYPLSAIIRRHLRHPTVSPRLYANIWFGALSFDFLESGQILKIEPNQRITL